MDLSIFNKFQFTIKPIGIKFELTPPKGVGRLNKMLALCEMFKEAQESPVPFYSDFDNHTCGGGVVCLGKKMASPQVAAGRLGPKLKIFGNPVANRRTLKSLPELAQGTAPYVQFAPLSKIDLEPDILLLAVKPRQAEIILRANSYLTGANWNSAGTGIGGCAWLLGYPYLTGKINYIPTGFSFGMIARELWPEGLILLSIPFDLLSHIIPNLQKMDWVLPAYQAGRDRWVSMFKEKQVELANETDIKNLNTK